MFRQGSPFGFSGGPFGFAPARKNYVKAKVGTGANPLVGGAQQPVTGVGFRPKAMLMMGTPQTVNGQSSGASLTVGGATAPSDQWSISGASQTSVTTSNTVSRIDTQLFGAIAPAIYLQAQLASFDPDGFTLNWPDADPAARIFNTLCLGGSIEVSHSTFQLAADNLSHSVPHGLGGAPEGLILLSSPGLSAAPPDGSSTLRNSFGAWAGGHQFAAGIRANNGATTTFTRRVFVNTGSIVDMNSGGAVARNVSVDSVDGTNVHLSYLTASIATTSPVHLMAIRGCKAKAGTFDLGGSLSPFDINCPGIKPKALMLFLVGAGVSSPEVPQSNAVVTLAFSDGTTTVSCGMTDWNGVTTTNTRRYQDSTDVVERNTTGEVVFRSAVSFGNQKVTLTPSSYASANNGQGGYLILGE